MVRRSIGLRLGPALFAGLFLCTLSGCPSDPYEPETWIDKLDDPGEVEQAITKLEELKDPVAIKPLEKVWRKHNKWPRVLRVMVALADQKNEKGGPYWKDAVPVLVEAVADFDIADPRSIADAEFAASALGRAKDPETVQTLITAATQSMPKLSPGQRVRIAAIQALGRFGSDDRAVSTLIKVLETDTDKQPLHIHAAAANALAETHSAKAIEPLLKAMYAVSPIYQQVRTALTRLGPAVVPRLIEVFQGKHEALAAYAKEQNFATDCDKAQGPKTTCKAPGNLMYKAASILGDLRAKPAAAILAAELKNKPQVSFFDQKTESPGPTHHAGILNALRLIGDTSVADQVAAYMKAETTDDGVRPIAIDVYSMLGRDKAAMAWMADQMKNDEQEEGIRKMSGLAYARLVTSDTELAPLKKMLDTYAAKRAEWDGKLKKATKDTEKEEAEGWIANYDSLIAEFRQYKARADIGIKCGADLKCYTEMLDKTADEIVKLLDVPDAAKLEKPVKEAYRIAAIERSLLEITKMGEKGGPALDKLLSLVDTTDRIVREGILLAMVQVAPKPCKKCEARLTEVVEAQKDQTTLDYLTADTKIVLNYFASGQAQAP